MRFVYINRAGRNPTTVKLFKKTLKEKGIEGLEIDSDLYDFSKITPLAKGDLLYSITYDHRSATLFKLLAGPDVTTIIERNAGNLYLYENVFDGPIIHQTNRLPVIKTVFDLTNDRNLLKKYVEYLDGFPVIIKAAGGSHGIGVIKIDSIESLYSVVDVLLNSGKKFVMREFIDYTEQARLIVLGNKVISSIEYKRLKDDFRSNAGENLIVIAKKFPSAIEETAVKATNLLGYEFGGVDILIDKSGKQYLAEVNLPCFFPRAQMATGDDISGMLIDYLVQKSKA